MPTHDKLIAIVKRHFTNKGYRVHSGLQFGCELVLYADSPGLVHSDFCVHVPSPVCDDDDDDDGDTAIDWRTVQTLARSMPDLRKTLIVARVRRRNRASMGSEGGGVRDLNGRGGDDGSPGDEDEFEYEVDELAIATEHAPLRHKYIPAGVGTQIKTPARGVGN
jgi:hypothetical protein